MEYGEVEMVKKDEAGLFTLIVDGEEVFARSVLVAAGSANRKLGVVREEYSGVHYCATCDGAFYQDKDVVVVGGGNSAVQEAFFLQKFAKHITIISATDITATEVLRQKLEEQVNAGKIRVVTNENIKEITGEGGKVDGVLLGNGEKIAASGVFVFIGQSPDVEFLGETKVELDECGYIKTNAEMMTDESGIFAAGDVRSGSIKQMVAAAGEGAAAAVAIGKHLSE
jgi:thioredoxin reductase (NADPH)